VIGDKKLVLSARATNSTSKVKEQGEQLVPTARVGPHHGVKQDKNPYFVSLGTRHELKPLFWPTFSTQGPSALQRQSSNLYLLYLSPDAGSEIGVLCLGEVLEYHSFPSGPSPTATLLHRHGAYGARACIGGRIQKVVVACSSDPLLSVYEVPLCISRKACDVASCVAVDLLYFF
jgi:hypothetical protein